MPKPQRKSDNSLTGIFWDLVERDPKLAAAIAFQLGALAGQAVHGSTARRLKKNGQAAFRSLAKSVQKAPGAMAKTLPDMPDLASLTGLSFLPGPSPKLQPRKRPSPQRSKKKAHKAA